METVVVKIEENDDSKRGFQESSTETTLQPLLSVDMVPNYKIINNNDYYNVENKDPLINNENVKNLAVKLEENVINNDNINDYNISYQDFQLTNEEIIIKPEIIKGKQ